eukprot:2930535-Amphidinium_carterae.1
MRSCNPTRHAREVSLLPSPPGVTNRSEHRDENNSPPKKTLLLMRLPPREYNPNKDYYSNSSKHNKD